MGQVCLVNLGASQDFKTRGVFNFKSDFLIFALLRTLSLGIADFAPPV